jgi:hypothetical protein
MKYRYCWSEPRLAYDDSSYRDCGCSHESPEAARDAHASWGHRGPYVREMGNHDWFRGREFRDVLAMPGQRPVWLDEYHERVARAAASPARALSYGDQHH